MNGTDSSASESNNDSDDWKSWPPDAVLHALISELKHPLTSIKGYAQLLANESTKEFHSKYVETILTIVSKMENMNKEIVEYLNDYYSKAREQNPKP